MQLQGHHAVTRAAKDGANADEIPGLVRCKLRLCCATRINLDIDIEIAETKSVGNIRTLQHEHYRFAFFESDLAGIKGEPFGYNVDSPGCSSLSPSRWCKECRCW